MTSWNYHSVPGVWHWHSLWKDEIVHCFNYYYYIDFWYKLPCFLTDDRVIILSPGENEREGDKSPSFFIKFTNTANKTFSFFFFPQLNITFISFTLKQFLPICVHFILQQINISLLIAAHSSVKWNFHTAQSCGNHYTEWCTTQESFCRDDFGFSIRFSLTKQKNLKK